MDQVLVVKEIISHYAQKTHPIFCSDNTDHHRRLQENILWALASPDVLMPWFSHLVKLPSQPGSLPRGFPEPKFSDQICYRSSLNPCMLWTRVKQCPRDTVKDSAMPSYGSLIWDTKNMLVSQINEIVTFTIGWKKWWTRNPLYLWARSYVYRICQIWISFWNRIVQNSPFD